MIPGLIYSGNWGGRRRWLRAFDNYSRVVGPKVPMPARVLVSPAVIPVPRRVDHR